ncbi:MAG TPA: class I SAM-dependent methyltransferase [Solirubrobacteraceae bacterium]
MSARAAYEAMADFYDEFTAGHRDSLWCDALETIAREAGLRGRRLLDVGCGTGRSFLPMLARGYAVTACDVSPAMLAEARRKAGGRATLLEHDMRALPRVGEFDLVWSLGDALNYLGTTGELRATFEGAARNLAPGGLLLVDVNTLATFRAVYSALLVRPGDERVLVLDGQGRADLEPAGLAEVWIDKLAAGPGGRWSRVRTVHRHRHHPEPVIRDALAGAGLRCVAVHGSTAEGALEPALDEGRHVKAVYLAAASVPTARAAARAR